MTLETNLRATVRRTLILVENKRNYLKASGDIVERVDPVFFSDPVTPAMKAMGMTTRASPFVRPQPIWVTSRSLVYGRIQGIQ
jgi:hypothetical protein